jgi:hypothetical protein
MRGAYLVSFLWLSLSVVFALMALSDLVFSKERSFKRFLLAIAMSYVWPFAMLSVAGRRVLFNTIKEQGK